MHARRGGNRRIGHGLRRGAHPQQGRARRGLARRDAEQFAERRLSCRTSPTGTSTAERKSVSFPIPLRPAAGPPSVSPAPLPSAEMIPMPRTAMFICGFYGYSRPAWRRVEYRFGFGRVGQPDAVVFFEQERDFEGVDRIQSESFAEQRRVGGDLFGGDLLQIQRFDNLLFELQFQIFHRIYSSFSVNVSHSRTPPPQSSHQPHTTASMRPWAISPSAYFRIKLQLLSGNAKKVLSPFSPCLIADLPQHDVRERVDEHRRRGPAPVVGVDDGLMAHVAVERCAAVGQHHADPLGGAVGRRPASSSHDATYASLQRSSIFENFMFGSASARYLSRMKTPNGTSGCRVMATCAVSRAACIRPASLQPACPAFVMTLFPFAAAHSFCPTFAAALLSSAPVNPGCPPAVSCLRLFCASSRSVSAPFVPS